MDQPRHFAPAAASALSATKSLATSGSTLETCGAASCCFRIRSIVQWEETAMRTLVSMLALGLVIAFSAPAFAGTKEPKTQAECTKAGMHWDTSAKKCSKGM